jgi:hypothetical protein
MTRRSPDIEIKEMGGSHYTDLYTAQINALPVLASDLAETVQLLLAEGLLVNDHGRIIPNPEKMQMA